MTKARIITKLKLGICSEVADSCKRQKHQSDRNILLWAWVHFKQDVNANNAAWLSGGFWLSECWRFENHWLLLSKKRRAKATSNEGHWKAQERRSFNPVPVPNPAVWQATWFFQFELCLLCSGHDTRLFPTFHSPAWTWGREMLCLYHGCTPGITFPSIPPCWFPDLATLRSHSSSPEKANAGTAIDPDASFPRRIPSVQQGLMSRVMH